MNTDTTLIKHHDRFIFAFVVFVHLCLCVISPRFGFAQPYPAKPVRLIVPFPSGGGVDGVARIVFARVSDSLNQQVVIDNRGGSVGIIAAETAARAAPDGYTLFFGTTATQAITPHYYRKLAYDPVTDFAPISLIAGAGYLLVVHPSVQATTVKEFIALAKAKPGVLNFSSSGNGTVLHLATELFRGMAGKYLCNIDFRRRFCRVLPE